MPPSIDDGLNIIVFDPATTAQRIPVEGSEYEANLIETTTPGQGASDAGMVKFAVVIGKAGTVIDVDPSSRTRTADFLGCGCD